MEQELTPEELRVLASLVEKSFTTPDQYPLTTNSLVNACNQKTSREPVVDYSAQLVDRTVLSLRDGGWARSVRGMGNRAFKHKHVIDERLGLNEAEQAVLAVLALRGAQSAGELCTRTERYGTFPGDREEAFAAVEATLVALAAREIPLVRNVGRSSGQSHDRWIQLLDGGVNANTDTPPAPASDSTPVVEIPSSDAEAAVAALTERIAALEQRVGDLEELL